MDIPTNTFITGLCPTNISPLSFLPLFGITPESTASVLKTTAQEDLERQQRELEEEEQRLQALANNPKARISPQDAAKIAQNIFTSNLNPHMIAPMKTLHFVTAVLDRIQHFNALKINFSAWNVTTSLREEVENDDLKIVDLTEMELFHGKLLPVIRHDAVKAIVKELFAEDFIPNYTPRPNGVYIEYIHDVNLNPVVTMTPVMPPPQNLNVPVTHPTANTPIVDGLKTPDNNMWQLVMNYLDGRDETTAKQVQSRLKGWKVTCQEIIKWAEDEGYTVFHNTAVPSRSVISE